MAKKKLKEKQIVILIIIAIITLLLSQLAYTGYASLFRQTMGPRRAPPMEIEVANLQLSARIDGPRCEGAGAEDQNSTVWFHITNTGDMISDNVSVEVWNYGALLGRLNTNARVRAGEIRLIGPLTIVPPDPGAHKFNFKLCDGAKCKDAGFYTWYILDSTQVRCGNGRCESDIGENAFNCVDCVGVCGNGRCEPGLGEHPHSCPQDCV